MSLSSKAGIENPGFSGDHGDREHVEVPIYSARDTITYSWKNVNVFALPEKGPFKGKHALREEKRIIDNVTGICRPGELIAIMGASGAGKTTLLNVLGSRSAKSLRIEGDLYVNKEKLDKLALTSQSAYVQQEDLFIGTCTVREQLLFQAQLRMKKDMSKEKRLQRVEEVEEQMGLKKCSNTYIGIPGRIKGISGGETKRLSFACEVLTDPPLMLCDEPTTGLDSFMAQTIVSAMKILASQDKSIISTIHQPSSEVFALFDRVLLLAEGRVAFLGKTQEALDFFSNLGRNCPLNFNPADFFIACLAIQPDYEKQCKSFVKKTCDAFADSKTGKAIEFAVENNMGTDHEQERLLGDRLFRRKDKKSPYRVGWLVQFWALMKRGMKEMAREPMLLRIKIAQTVMVGLLVGLIYLDTDYGDYDQANVSNINGALFIVISNLSFQFAFGVVNTFCGQLPIFLKEHLSGMYTTSAFYVTKNLAELPSSIVLPFLFLIVIYYMINLTRTFEAFFTMAFALILVSNAALSFGYLISCVASDLRMALAIAAPMLIPFMIFGGYFLNADTVPSYFIWMKYISWFNYGNEAILIAQWKDVKEIECDDSILCNSNGQELLDSLGYDEDNLWIDFVCLVALVFLFRIAGYLFLLRKTYALK